jgi:hypothetical protein
MNPSKIQKDGFLLRIVKCPKCAEVIIHPKDEQEFINFNQLRKKHFCVKMRFVGNSYAVSIPKEIVNFMKEQQTLLNDMVNLCFEDVGRLRLDFNQGEQNDKKRN